MRAIDGQPIWAQSANVAAASAVATLPAYTGLTTYIEGFDVTALGATAATVVAITVAGLASGTLTLQMAVVAGATLDNSKSFRFPKPLPALPSSVIVVTVPSLGTGNTNSSVTAYGSQA